LFILTNSFNFLYLACIAHPPPLSLCFDSRTVAGIKTAHSSFSFIKLLLSLNVQTHCTESFLQFCSCQMLFRSVMHRNACPVYSREHEKNTKKTFPKKISSFTRFKLVFQSCCHFIYCTLCNTVSFNSSCALPTSGLVNIELFRLQTTYCL